MNKRNLTRSQCGAVAPPAPGSGWAGGQRSLQPRPRPAAGGCRSPGPPERPAREEGTTRRVLTPPSPARSLSPPAPAPRRRPDHPNGEIPGRAGSRTDLTGSTLRPLGRAQVQHGPCADYRQSWALPRVKSPPLAERKAPKDSTGKWRGWYQQPLTSIPLLYL